MFKCMSRLNVLRKLLNGCERISSLEYAHTQGSKGRAVPSDGDRPKVRLDLYFDKKSLDFGHLMDLLAEASGIVQSLR